MTFKRNSAASLVFIAIFFVYVLSPLIFPCNSAICSGIDQAGFDARSSGNPHVFFEKLVCMKSCPESGSREHSSSRIIVHKSRTIVSEDEAVKLTRLNNHYTSEEYGAVPSRTALSLFVPSGDEVSTDGFRRSSSGLSPPSV